MANEPVGLKRWLRASAQPGFEGVWIEPGATPAVMTHHWEENDIRYGQLMDGEVLVIGHITLQDGKVFKYEG